ncbi:IS630 family transposase [Fimbriiglobus ruber]|uniref:IS630 family transposase n=1 Tax=Fimbriiglobus ruber TaxID=1908690 RepID=UPI000B4BE78A|nr:IS630 family transposase [Fimbriiglobus ruber]
MKHPHDWREWRRLRAWYLFQHGWTEREIAEALGASKGAVSQWLAKARNGGRQALLSGVRGTHAKLTAEQKRRIPDFLWHGPEAYGFRGEVWTCPRVVDVLAREFGVTYHRDHVSRILKDLGWTPQIPITRAIQRDEVAIAHWRTDVWPELRQRAVAEHRTLVFVDESGFYLLPSVVRTYGPQGHTPVVAKTLTRDHLSVMAGLTPAGALYTLVRRESLSSSESVVFLKHVLIQAGKKLLVIWDGSPIHRWGAVRAFLAEEGAKRIHLEVLPGYAPDLSPLDQGCWHHLKDVEMANLSCRDMEELHLEFDLAVGRLRQKPRLIRSFFAAAGLAL